MTRVSQIEVPRLLESVADRIAGRGGESDHGVVWADEGERKLLSDLADEHELDVWDDVAAGTRTLFEAYYEPRGGMITNATHVYARDLPSGRSVLASYSDLGYGWEALGIVLPGEPLGEQRAAQATLAGETGEVWLNALPTSFETSCSGLVAVDAVHHGLRQSTFALANLYGEDEFCCGHQEILESGEERRAALLTAIEEELEEENDPEGILAALHDQTTATPGWLYALDDKHWSWILALQDEQPVLPLYGTPPARWQKQDPHDLAGDLWYVSAALLALYAQL